MESRAEIVADYLQRGWVPFAYGGQFTPGEGWQRSRADSTTLERVGGGDTPVALLLGRPSKLVAVDIDPRNGGSVNAVIKYYDIPLTRTVKTPSGGYHLLFKYDGDLKKTKGEKTGIPEMAGVDLLADGSHILAPPTVRVGHPEGKPDGKYELARDVEPIDLESVPALLADWQSAVARFVPVTGEPIDELPLELYDKVLGIHKSNVEIAAAAPEGSRDDTCIARIGASMRIALALPDDVLSADKVREDFEAGVEYEIRDMDGKIARAIEWAEQHVWTELKAPEGYTLPDGVPPEMATEYFEVLTRLRIREAAADAFKVEKLEAAARRTPFGKFLQGQEFFDSKPDFPEWLVEGLIHHAGSVLLAGKYKSGKSTLMLNLIKSLTTGTPFLGFHNVPKPLRVVYADMELGESMAWRWFDQMPGIDASKFVYMPRVGQGNQLDMRSDTMRAKLARKLMSVGADVLIVDPMSPVMSALGVDENSAETVRPLLDAFDMLKVEANLQTVVLTHHTGHQDAGRARGSTAWLDWCSSFMSVIRQGEDADSPRVFRAFGRDVSVATSQLHFDPATKELKLASAVYTPSPDDNPF